MLCGGGLHPMLRARDILDAAQACLAQLHAAAGLMDACRTARAVLAVMPCITIGGTANDRAGSGWPLPAVGQSDSHEGDPSRRRLQTLLRLSVV